ncbi:ABC transporter permease [Amaricoccus solimangrovi]|nr:ABC transporter permease [Amaricoccus solimangrovi]
MDDGAMAMAPSMAAPRPPLASPDAPEMAPAARAGHVRFQRLRVLFALMVREMQTDFGRSWGGYFWAIAEPLGGILLLSLAFSLALRSPPLGSSFILFYASGYIPFNAYRVVSSSVTSAVRSNRGLLSHPVVGVVDAVLSKFLLSTLTMGVVAVVLYAAILATLDQPVEIDLGTVTLAYFLAALFGLGIGAVNCVLFGFFPTWRSIWKILSRPKMIASGVLFLYESVPTGLQDVLWYNPLAHVIGLSRAGVYGGYHPGYVSIPYVAGISLGLFVIGLYLLRRHTAALLDR